MITLGMSDGPRPTAALIQSGRVVGLRREPHGAQRAPYGVPWTAAEAVLHDAGLRPSDVEHVGIAGKYTPMLLLRQHPSLRRFGGNAFSVARDAHAFAQSFLRKSGLGAFESDRAADWWDEELARRGYHPRRVQLVDIHRTLAAAAYRCQPDDDVLVVSLQPMGDGVVAAVHRGEAAYLERAWEQRGSSALDVHLTRCAEVLGVPPASPIRELSSLAGAGSAHRELVDELASWLRVEDGRIRGRRRPIPGVRRDHVYDMLAEVPRADAAASLLQNLRDAVCGLVTWHLRKENVRDVMLSGALIQDPRLVARVADLPGVHTVSALPFGGAAAMSVGAAASVAGMAPQSLPVEGLGPAVDDDTSRAAVAASGCKPVKRRNLSKWLADQLIAGKSVARLQDRGGLGRWGLGRSAVMVRADQPEAVESVRRNLGRSPDEQPGCLMCAETAPNAVQHADVLERALRHGVAAVSVAADLGERIPGAVSRDGRVELARVTASSDPVLYRALQRLQAETGCPAVVCFPFAPGDSEPVVDPAAAVRVFTTSRLDAMVLGSYGVLGPSC